MQPFPVLWICGPSGVGKSSVGYELFDQLTRAGTAAAYVDLDQIGHSYPAPADDPRHHGLRSRALGQVWAGFRAAGAECLLVSGLVDNPEQVGLHAEQLPGAALTVCRLRVDSDELRERFAQRGWMPQLTEDAVRNGVELERTGFADLVLDTTGLSIPAVAARIRATGWPARGGASPTRSGLYSQPSPLPAERPADVAVLWICGPPAVGKSTVGFDVFLRVIGEGTPAAYVDLAQIGFYRPALAGDPDQHRLKAAQLGRLWPELYAAGARRLIVSGGVTDPADIDRYRSAVPGKWTVCRLTAGPERLTERTLLRGSGGGPAIPGDVLRGRPRAELLRRAADSARIADTLERAGIGDFSIGTDDLTPPEAAALVMAG